MGKRLKINPEELKRREQELMNFLYENELEKDFEQFSKYHFRVKEKVDIWPISRKYYVRGTNGSKVYTNLRDLKKVLCLT